MARDRYCWLHVLPNIDRPIDLVRMYLLWLSYTLPWAIASAWVPSAMLVWGAEQRI